MQINYSSYVHVIEKGMNRRNMTGMAKVLFDFMCDHEEIVSGRITKKDIEAGIAHKRYIVPDKESIEWFRGEHDVAETLKKGAGEAAIIADATAYFESHVIEGLINPQKLEIVINAMSELIENDKVLDEGLKQRWIGLRDNDDYGGFLAEIFLYAVPQPNCVVTIDQEIVAPELDDEDARELRMFESMVKKHAKPESKTPPLVIDSAKEMKYVKQLLMAYTDAENMPCMELEDYKRHGKINVEEFEDHLVFINEGSFIPETIEKALEPGYKPPYYRNAFLCNAMVNMYMIDTNSMGIPMIYNIQKARCFPLPSYDLDVVNRVSVTVYGKVLDKNYTRLLHSNGDLDLKTVFLLDQVQKRKTIAKDDYKSLRKSGLVEGRYPALYVSYRIAEAVGDKAGYVRNKGLDEKILKELIISAVLTEEKQYKKLSNLLQKMKKEGMVDVRGSAVHAEWFLVE